MPGVHPLPQRIGPATTHSAIERPDWASHALDAAKKLREIEKDFDEATYKLQVALLTSSLAEGRRLRPGALFFSLAPLVNRDFGKPRRAEYVQLIFSWPNDYGVADAASASAGALAFTDSSCTRATAAKG
jgi:hypothetical protein